MFVLRNFYATNATRSFLRMVRFFDRLKALFGGKKKPIYEGGHTLSYEERMRERRKNKQLNKKKREEKKENMWFDPALQ